jgi:xanthine/uracil/vitamin C permease (AzgA family)
MEPNTITSGSVICGVVSSFLSVAWAFLPRRKVGRALVVFAPFVVANVAYWPASGGSSAEYSTWAFIIVTPLYLAGLIASAIVFTAVNWLRRRWAAWVEG